MSELAGRVVVLSPHLDDAVMSLGATVARCVRIGTDVEVLTVFAGSPDSLRPAGDWDALAGFATAGEAARQRRVEDSRACEILGATPVWLEFPDSQYAQEGDRAAVRAEVRSAVGNADALLMPGWPLRHGDHVWLTRTMLQDPSPCRRLGLYVEQPYAWRTGGSAPRSPSPPSVVAALGTTAFTLTETEPADRSAKWKALGEYRSQLPHLGPPELRKELTESDEAIAWLPWGEGGTPP